MLMYLRVGGVVKRDRMKRRRYAYDLTLPLIILTNLIILYYLSLTKIWSLIEPYNAIKHINPREKRSMPEVTL